MENFGNRIKYALKDLKTDLTKNKYEELKEKYPGILKVVFEYNDWDREVSYRIYGDKDTLEEIDKNEERTGLLKDYGWLILRESWK